MKWALLTLLVALAISSTLAQRRPNRNRNRDDSSEEDGTSVEDGSSEEAGGRRGGGDRRRGSGGGRGKGPKPPKGCLKGLKRAEGCEFKQICRDNTEEKSKPFVVDFDQIGGACPRVGTNIEDVEIPEQEEPCVCPYCNEDGVMNGFLLNLC